MEIVVKTESLAAFLQKCYFDKLVTDLVLKAENGNLVARFSDSSKTMYCEVYERQVKIVQPGHICIPSLKKVMSCLSRFGELIMIKSNESQFVISDKKSSLKCQQTAAEFITSFGKIQSLNLLDRDKMVYFDEYKLESGFVVDHFVLQQLVDDAKAFGFESYNIMQIGEEVYCTIENRDLGEKFRRKLDIVEVFGGKIENVTIGVGFKEMVKALSKEKDEDKKNIIKFYIHPVTGLMTNKSGSFYYAIHCQSKER